MKEYAVIFEKTETGWSAIYRALVWQEQPSKKQNILIREGIEFQIEGLRADGEPVPEPATRVMEVAIPA